MFDNNPFGQSETVEVPARLIRTRAPRIPRCDQNLSRFLIRALGELEKQPHLQGQKPHIDVPIGSFNRFLGLRDANIIIESIRECPESYYVKPDVGPDDEIRLILEHQREVKPITRRF
jgi:hypothetical protein